MPYLSGSPVVPLLSVLLCLALLIPSAIMDVSSRRIPNKITAPLILVGLVFTGYTAPFDYISKGSALILIFIFGCTRLGERLYQVIGMGDVKLIMALCTLWQPVYAAVTVVIAALIMSVAQFIRRPGSIKATVHSSLQFLCGGYIPPERTAQNTAPFAPYYLAAYVLFQGGLILWHILSQN